VIVAFDQLLAERGVVRAAVGAFTCYETTTATGAVAAAEAASTPLVLLVSKASFASRGGDLLLTALTAIAERAAVPACVQLDHVDDLREIKRAVELGVGAVMADGSTLPFVENVALVREVVGLARSSEVGVEAELGHIAGGEDVAHATRVGALTDPREAANFVRESGADCLAVSIGNVHGTYASPPDLDWARLDAIRAAVDVPLSLHGASGLPADDVRRAVVAGVAKVNVNAELRRRAFEVLAERVSDLADGYRMLELQEAFAQGAEEVVRGVVTLLAGQSANNDL
jgi:tagatose 1,6-diphosphate aldolase GatY/KbaY